MNLKDNDNIKTINIINVVEQLNNITDVIRGSESGGLTEIQLKNINENIDKVKNKLQSLETDVDKYIDEEELNEKLDDVKSSINFEVDNKIKNNISSIIVVMNENEYNNLAVKDENKIYIVKES